MVFGKRFVFLELEKTGSTYSRYVLNSTPDAFQVGKKHNIFDELKPKYQDIFKNSVKVGSIRSPFEYYVSLYGFACSARGGLYTFVAKRPDVLNWHSPWDIVKLIFCFIRYRSTWLTILSDVDSIENFKSFLNLILMDNPTSMGAHFGLSDSHNHIGALTHKYLRTFTYGYVSKVKSFREYNDFLEHDLKHNFVDVMLRNESMKQDLLDNAISMGIKIQDMENAIKSRPARSSTSSKHRPYQEYYDEESIQWVMDKEKLIVDKYNYHFE